MYSNHTQAAREFNTLAQAKIVMSPLNPKTSTFEQLASDEEVDEFSNARSSVDDLLSPPAMPTDSADQLFTPVQLSAIQDTISSSISAAHANLPCSGNPLLDLASSSTRSRHASNVATPLGINRPVDKTL